MNTYKQIEPTERLQEADVAYALMGRTVDSGVLMAFKDVTGVSGELLAGWLHVTPKTLRSYLSRKVLLSDTVGEQVLLLQALFKRGCRMFGSHKAFETWLSRENGLLDGLKPVALLGSVSGIRLVESRLIGLEYGDNAWAMVVYRICREAFADSLTASGMAGRWNLQGQHVLYASATRSLAALEQLTNRSGLSMREPYTVMVIELTDRPEAYEVVDTVDLPSDWQRLSGYSRLQELGGTWYRQQRSMVFRVPSVLVPQESNFVINTSHPDFVTSVKVVGREDFGWDNRLV